MIEVATERPRREFVGELAARLDQTGAGYAVHPRRVDAVEMHGMGVRAAVLEDDPQALAFDASQRRAGNAPVVGPGRKEDPRCDLDLAIEGGDGPFADPAAVGVGPDAAIVEIGEDGGRVEAVPAVIDPADDTIAARGMSVAGMRLGLDATTGG